MIPHNLKTGDLVFVQRQALAKPGLMFEMSGIAYTNRHKDNIHVVATSGQVSFPADMIHSTKRQESTGKIWVYLK
jgi:hypothetical protein